MTSNPHKPPIAPQKTLSRSTIGRGVKKTFWSFKSGGITEELNSSLLPHQEDLSYYLISIWWPPHRVISLWWWWKWYWRTWWCIPPPCRVIIFRMWGWWRGFVARLNAGMGGILATMHQSQLAQHSRRVCCELKIARLHHHHGNITWLRVWVCGRLNRKEGKRKCQ